MLPKRDWMEMTWQDFAGADTELWIAVLPLAAVEQHGPHLPLGVDAFLAEAYLAKARSLIPEKLRVSFLPVQSVGHSEEHVGFPGTLTISAQTATRAWTEIGDSVYRAGVRKLVLMSSHGGNSAAMDLVARDLRARHDMLVVTCGWHRFGYPEGLFTTAEKTHGIHGGDIETSLMRAARPETVRMDQASNNISATLGWSKEFHWLNASRPAGFGWMTQDLNASGAVGDALKASPEKGNAALEHGTKAFVELLGEVDRFDLAALRKGPLG
jgi:creatinine amidohydrolase